MNSQNDRKIMMHEKEKMQRDTRLMCKKAIKEMHHDERECKSVNTSWRLEEVTNWFLMWNVHLKKSKSGERRAPFIVFRLGWPEWCFVASFYVFQWRHRSQFLFAFRRESGELGVIFWIFEIWQYNTFLQHPHLCILLLLSFLTFCPLQRLVEQKRAQWESVFWFWLSFVTGMFTTSLLEYHFPIDWWFNYWWNGYRMAWML